MSKISKTADERTRIGYYCFCQVDEETWQDVVIGYYTLPDGSAEVVRTDRYYVGPSSRLFCREVTVEVERFAPGTWERYCPVSTFGSRGGSWIQPRTAEGEK